MAVPCGYDAGMWMFVLVEVGPDGPGTIEILGEDGAVLGAAAVPDPRIRSVVVPEGGESAVLEHATARVRVHWPPGATSVRGGRLASRVGPAGRAGGGAVPILASGPSEERLDLVVLGDGYGPSEQERFAEDAQALVDFLGRIEPYERYADLLNVWRVDRVSADSGVGHRDDPADTAYGCAYDCAGVDRLVCCDDERVVATIDAALPDADGAIVLLNDPEYGGSGGFTYATAYNGESGLQVAAHELGHSLVGLWDEYSYGVSGQGEGPNCARSSDPWEPWLGANGVDAFPECSFTNLVRPTDEGCMMRTLRDGYCPVCREQVILAMHSRLGGLIRATVPAAGEPVADRITVETSVPAERLAFEWTLDGEVVAETAEAEVRCSGWSGELSLRVSDPTGWVRSDPQGLLTDADGPWTVAAEKCAEPPVACGCRTSPAGRGWCGVLLAATVVRLMHGRRPRS